jgi:nitroreductase/NAD-dependent dihydropyrimidine dehydrogenase PreA subunit
MALLRNPSAPRPNVTVDQDRCRGCGLCVKVCSGGTLYQEGDAIRVDTDRHLGCVECGHCVAVCPAAAVTVRGTDLGPEDMGRIPARKDRPSYSSLRNLLDSRRSVRLFKDRPVSRAALAKILDAASTAPMGIPPSPVEILVLHGRDKVKAFRDDVLDAMLGMRWMFSPVMRFVMRPFMGSEMVEVLRDFVLPVMQEYETKRNEGVDRFLYDAPLAMYFHVSPYGEAADAVIAVTYAMLAAESMGLGSCIIGMVGPFLSRNKKLKEKYGVPLRNRPGIAIVFGYPVIRYRRTVKRRLARVHYA